jgi:hypothetical protein
VNETVTPADIAEPFNVMRPEGLLSVTAVLLLVAWVTVPPAPGV